MSWLPRCRLGIEQASLLLLGPEQRRAVPPCATIYLKSTICCGVLLRSLMQFTEHLQVLYEQYFAISVLLIADTQPSFKASLLGSRQPNSGLGHCLLFACSAVHTSSRRQ